MKTVYFLVVLAMASLLINCNESTPIPKDSPVYGKVEIINGRLIAKEGYTFLEVEAKGLRGNKTIALIGGTSIHAQFVCVCDKNESSDGCSATIIAGGISCAEIVCNDCAFYVKIASNNWEVLAPAN